MVLLYLDPGHGGHDSGASGHGLKEKDLVLDIAHRINDGLDQYEDIEVVMSRSTDVFIPLTDRTSQANNLNADAFLSIHINAHNDPLVRGFETFIYPETQSSTIAYQNVMHEEIFKQMGPNILDRGKKKQNFHVLRASKMKSLLTESLFISNPSDARLLADSGFIQRVAQGHINGLVEFFGLKKKVEPVPEPLKKLWYVQVGAFEEKPNAEAVVDDLTKIGYRPIVKYE